MKGRRILYVINGFDPGGAEHGLLMLLQSEFFAGHDIKILALCRGRGTLATRIAMAIGASNVVLASTGETLTARACLAGAIAMWREQRHWRPDVVVLSLKQANIIGRLVACLFPFTRCVSFEHISRYRARKAEWIYQYLLWALSFRVDEIWADCRDTHQETSRYFMPRQRRQQIVALFCADEAAPHKRAYYLRGPLRLAAAGRLVPRKNFQIAIEAVRLLRERGRAVHLDIFGDGPEEAALQRLIDDAGLGDAVQLVGYREDWCRQILDHDLFVNLGDTEGFCIVVAEAMMAALPVIATNVGGIQEYGVDGHNLLTLELPSIDGLVLQIERLSEDAELRRRIGEAARRDILAQFSSAAIRRRSQLVFAETVDGTTPAAVLD